MQVLCKTHLHKQCPLVLCCEFYDSPIDRNSKVRLSACLGWLSQNVDRTKTRTQIFCFKFSIFILPYTGLPRWFSGKQSACQCRRHRFNSWIRKIPWRRKGQPTPVFLPGKSRGQRSLVAYSPWGHKESDTTEGWASGTSVSKSRKRWTSQIKKRERISSCFSFVWAFNRVGNAH